MIWPKLSRDGVAGPAGGVAAVLWWGGWSRWGGWQYVELHQLKRLRIAPWRCCGAERQRAKVAWVGILHARTIVRIVLAGIWRARRVGASAILVLTAVAVGRERIYWWCDYRFKIVALVGVGGTHALFVFCRAQHTQGCNRSGSGSHIAICVLAREADCSDHIVGSAGQCHGVAALFDGVALPRCVHLERPRTQGAPRPPSTTRGRLREPGTR